ncbi:MAG: hypothetical protein ACLUVC_13930 [Longibaculum sp.]
MFFRSQGLIPSLNQQYIYSETQTNEYSFLDKAFQANITIAEKTYQTKFIQGIANGNLSPEKYGSVLVLDAYYCYEAAKSIWNGCKKSENDSELQDLLKHFYNSYTSYNATFYTNWHVLTSKSVAPIEDFQGYAMHERRVSLEEDAIYLLAALMPCYYLWPWMANKIAADSSKKPGVYQFWVDGNKGSGSSARAADRIITNWIKAGKPFDENKALQIFSQSMQWEYTVFTSEGQY